MSKTSLSPKERNQRDLQAFARHLQRQRVAFAEITGMIANAMGRVNLRGRDKAPADPAVKARRKLQRRARAITKLHRKP